MGAERRYRALEFLSGALIALVGLFLSVSLFVHLRAAGAVGESDGANTLVVARNLLEGRGFSVDYVATHLRAWDSVHHPEDSFPLLHPSLIAAAGLLTGDVVLASHGLSGLFLFLYLAGLPLLVARYWGPAPSLLLAAGLISQEASYSLFSRPLNDAPAMVFLGASVIFLVRSIEAADARASRVALFACAASAAIATQLKLSVAFFVIAGAGALFILDHARSRKARLQRASTVLMGAFFASVPLLLWHVATLGEVGLPQNAIGRGFAREAGAAPEFWAAFERIRVFLPRHPEFLRTTGEWIAQEGFYAAAVVAPFRRLSTAVTSGFWAGTVVPLPLLGMSALSFASPRKGAAPWVASRLLWLGVAAALAIPIYSHFEPRYLMPLRPLVAFAAAMSLHEATCEIDALWRSRGALFAMVVFALAALWGAAHVYEWDAALVLWGALALACGASILFRLRGVGAAASVAGGAAVGFSLCFALLSANGVRALSSAFAPDLDRERGALLAEAAGPGVTLLARRVWSLSFWSRVPLVMIPYHAEDACEAARLYGASGIVVEDADRERQPELAEVVGEPIASRPGIGVYRLRCVSPE